MKRLLARHHKFIGIALMFCGLVAFVWFSSVKGKESVYDIYLLLSTVIVPFIVIGLGKLIARDIRRKEHMAYARQMGMPFLPEYLWKWAEEPINAVVRQKIMKKYRQAGLDKVMVFKASLNITRASTRLFSAGRGYRLTNLFYSSGEGGLMAVFDYTYEVGYGESTLTNNHTVALFANARRKYPGFTLSPDSVFNKLNKSPQIEFPKDSGLPEAWTLKAEKEQPVREFLDPTIWACIRGMDEMWMEGAGEIFLVFTPSLTEDIKGFVKDASQIHDTFRARLEAMSD